MPESPESPEHLGDLLRAGVDDLGGGDVPRPPLDAIVHRGRRLRARRRLATGIGALAAVAAVGLGTTLVVGDEAPRSDRERVADGERTATVGVAARRAYLERGTWSIDDTVHVGDATWRTPSVLALVQTSAGVVVQHGDDRSPDFTLVRPDGSTRPVDVPAGVTEVVGDVTAPLVAWVRLLPGRPGGAGGSAGGEGVEAHVLDLDSGRELWSDTQVTPGVDGARGTPRIQLDGDDVSVTLPGGGTSLLWIWRGDDGPQARSLGVASMRQGRAVVLEPTGTWTVRDVESDRVLLRLPRSYAQPQLSPDGERVLFGAEPYADLGEPSDAAVTDVATGRRVALPDVGVAAGWTPSGAIVAASADGRSLVRCTPAGVCTATTVPGAGPVPGSPLRVGDQAALR